MQMTELVLNKILKIIYPLFYIGYLGKKTIYYNVNNNTILRFRVNTYDKISFLETWKSKTYIGSDFKIKEDDIVVDIGAYIGTFSVLASRKCKKGKVIAFEPNKENYSILTENIKINKLNNIKINNQAVTNIEGKKSLYLSNLNFAAHSIYGADSKKSIVVNSTNLKNILKKNKVNRINYLKIDAEGSEYDILLNASPSILSKIDKIVIEYHDYFKHGHNYNELVSYLEDNGFRVKVCGNWFIRKIFRTGILKAKKLFKRSTFSHKK